MKILKKSLLLIIISTLLTIFVSCLNTGGGLAGTGRTVFDDCNVLSEEEISSLEEKTKKIKEDCGITAVILLSDIDTNGLSDDYACDFLEYNGYDGNNIMLFLDTYNRVFSVVTNGSGKEYFKPDFIKEIKADGEAMLSEGSYYEILDGILDKIKEITDNSGEIYE